MPPVVPVSDESCPYNGRERTCVYRVEGPRETGWIRWAQSLRMLTAVRIREGKDRLIPGASEEIELCSLGL